MARRFRSLDFFRFRLRMAGLPGQFPGFRRHFGEFLFQLPVEPPVLPSHPDEILDREDENHDHEDKPEAPEDREPARIAAEPLRRRDRADKNPNQRAQGQKKKPVPAADRALSPGFRIITRAIHIREPNHSCQPDATKFHASGLFIHGRDRYIRRMPPARLKVLKTYKLFIGGKFPRTESGRTMTTRHATTGGHLAHYCHASRKDLRDAIVAARAALPGWSGTTAYLRGQILYRAAEMIEGRAESFANEITAVTGARPTEARREVGAAVDILVHHAGWTDKIGQVFGSVNPVASPHFNFTFPEPCGVVGVFAPDQPSLLGLTTLLARVILSGNTCVALASETNPLPALSLAEALATSDLPGGVINLLTGQRAELAPWLASHLDVNAVLDASGDPEILKTLQGGAEANLKRVHDHSLPSSEAWFGDAARDPYRALDTVEFKTAWHPMGM